MTFISLLCLGLAFVAVASGQAVVVEEEDHLTCSCAAEKYNFVINCANKQIMSNAVAALAANKCDTTCSSNTCLKNFFILQAHHDYCLESELSDAIEDSLHIYEDRCEHCDIIRKYDKDLPNCPKIPDCKDGSGTAAYTAMLNAKCLNKCSSAFCTFNFQILKGVHDLCEEDDLSEEAELAFHDFEEACEAANCNVGNANTNLEQLVCTKPGEPPFKICFSGSSTVTLEDGSSVAMKHLQIGDRVQVSADGKFDTIYSFGHYEPNTVAEYLRIQTTTSKQAIELSAQHMLFLANKKYAVPAALVKVGDVLLGAGAVTQIDSVLRKGAFAPFTGSGTIVVNHVVASNYVSLTGRTTFMGVVDMHRLAHLAVTPRRILCQMMSSGCRHNVEQYTVDGVATWIPLQTATFLAAHEGTIMAAVLLLAAASTAVIVVVGSRRRCLKAI